MLKSEKDDLLLLQISLLKNAAKIFKDARLPGSLYVVGSILSERFDYVSDVDLIYIGEADSDYQKLRRVLKEFSAKSFDIAFLTPEKIVEFLTFENVHFLFLKQLNYQHKLIAGEEMNFPTFRFEEGAYAKILRSRIHMIHARIIKRRLSNLAAGLNHLDGRFNLTFFAEGQEWLTYKDIVEMYLEMADFLLVSQGRESTSKWSLLTDLSKLKSDPLYPYFEMCVDLYRQLGRYVPLTNLEQLNPYLPLFNDLDHIVSNQRFKL